MAGNPEAGPNKGVAEKTSELVKNGGIIAMLIGTIALIANWRFAGEAFVGGVILTGAGFAGERITRKQRG